MVGYDPTLQNSVRRGAYYCWLQAGPIEPAAVLYCLVNQFNVLELAEKLQLFSDISVAGLAVQPV